MSYDPYSNPYQAAPYPHLPPKPGPSGADQVPLVLAIISVITGIMGFLTCMCCIFLPLPVASLATGIPVFFMRGDQNAKTIAIVGVICAGLSLVGFVLVNLLGLATTMIDPQFRQQFNRP